MIDFRAGLRAFLLADNTIKTTVGNVRIHGLRLPTGTMPGPSIVYSLISENTDHHLTGPSGLVFVRVQIDAWAKSEDVAANLALLVKDRLDGYAGPWPFGPDSPGEFVTIHGVRAENARPDYDATANLYRSSRDYRIDYWER